MSELKQYGKQTLVGGWFEENAKPLNGVVADYGNREYSTTFKTDFAPQRAVRSTWQAAQASRRARYGSGLVTVDNIQRYNEPNKEASDPTNFRSALPGGNRDESKFYADTTTGASFGIGSKPTLLEKKLRNGRFAKAAGVGAIVSKGMQASGAIGERLMNGSDPQNDTAAQRSWLYSEDAMFKAPKVREEETKECYATLNVKGDGADARPAPRKNDTLKKGYSVFSDE